MTYLLYDIIYYDTNGEEFTINIIRKRLKTEKGETETEIMFGLITCILYSHNTP